MTKYISTRLSIFVILLVISSLKLTIEASALDVTAASCSNAHIQAAVDQVYNANGGSVYIPAGTCNHGGMIRMSDGINLIGAGEGQTIIHNAYIMISTRFYFFSR